MNVDPLGPSAAFPYLGCIFAYYNSDWVALYQNLRKSRWSWVIFTKVITKMVSMVQVWGLFYKAVVQTVLIWEKYMGGDRGNAKSIRGIP